jgi:hypothetical protein
MNEVRKIPFHTLGIIVGAGAFGFFGVGQFKIVFCVSSDAMIFVHKKFNLGVRQRELTIVIFLPSRSHPRPVLIGHSSGINLILPQVSEDCFRGQIVVHDICLEED